MSERTANLVPAVDRALQILLSFNSGDESYGVSDLSRMLDINKSTVFDILNTLTFYNVLEREPDTKRYRLGPTLFHLGNLVGGRLSVRDVAHPFVRDLAAEFDSTVILATFTPNCRVMVVDSAEPELNFKISVSTGSRINHWSGVFGKIFHAAMDPEALQELRRVKPLRPLTSNTVVDAEVHDRELEWVRELGYATDDEEFLEGVRAVGVPVNDREGRVAAALIVMGFVSSMDGETMERLKQELPRAGRRISELLGARDYPQWNGTWAE